MNKDRFPTFPRWVASISRRTIPLSGWAISKLPERNVDLPADDPGLPVGDVHFPADDPGLPVGDVYFPARSGSEEKVSSVYVGAQTGSSAIACDPLR